MWLNTFFKYKFDVLVFYMSLLIHATLHLYSTTGYTVLFTPLHLSYSFTVQTIFTYKTYEELRIL